MSKFSYRTLQLLVVVANQEVKLKPSLADMTDQVNQIIKTSAVPVLYKEALLKVGFSITAKAFENADKMESQLDDLSDFYAVLALRFGLPSFKIPIEQKKMRELVDLLGIGLVQNHKKTCNCPTPSLKQYMETIV